MKETIFILLLTCTSIFMILLILIQRGKGGGLAGAFGGMGGQSAFGTKAGDTFTKITVVTAVLWFVLCIAALTWLRGGGFNLGEGNVGQLPGGPPGQSEPLSEPPPEPPSEPPSQ